MKKNTPMKFAVIITLVIATLLIVLVVVSSNQNAETNDEMTLDKQPSTDGQPTIGEANAPVSIVEFGDFKCPACKAWSERIYPQIINDYVEPGNAQFSFVNVTFHGAESELASLASEAVYKQDQDAYWDFNKALFEEQPSDDLDSEWITTEKILEVASAISEINTEQLESDIANNVGSEEVKKDIELVSEFKVQRTPTIIINDVMIEDPFDYEAIQRVIENELEEN